MAVEHQHLLEQLSRDKLFSIYQFLLLESRSLEELSRSSSKSDMIRSLAQVLSRADVEYCVEFFENYEFYEVPSMKWAMLDALPDELLATLHTIYLDDVVEVEEHRELVDRLGQSPYFLKEDARKFYLWYNYFRKRITLDQLAGTPGHFNVPVNPTMQTQRMDLQANRNAPLFSMATHGDVLGLANIATPTLERSDTLEITAPKRTKPEPPLSAPDSADLVQPTPNRFVQSSPDLPQQRSKSSDAIPSPLYPSPQPPHSSHSSLESRSSHSSSADRSNETIELTAFDLDSYLAEREGKKESSSRRRDEPTRVDHAFARVVEEIKKRQSSSPAPDAVLSSIPSVSSAHSISLDASVASGFSVLPPTPPFMSPASAPISTEAPATPPLASATAQRRKFESHPTIIINTMELNAALEQIESFEASRSTATSTPQFTTHQPIQSTSTPEHRQNISHPLILEPEEPDAELMELEPLEESLDEPLEEHFDDDDSPHILDESALVEEPTLSKPGKDGEPQPIFTWQPMAAGPDTAENLDAAPSSAPYSPNKASAHTDPKHHNASTGANPKENKTPPSANPKENHASASTGPKGNKTPPSADPKESKTSPDPISEDNPSSPDNATPSLPGLSAPTWGAMMMTRTQLDLLTFLLYRISLVGAPYGRIQIRAIRLFMQRILGCDPAQLRWIRDKLKELQTQDLPLVPPPLTGLTALLPMLSYGMRLHFLHTAIFLLGVKTLSTLERHHEFLHELAVELGIAPEDVSFFDLFNIGREEIQLGMQDCLELFGLESGAKEEDIRKAHRDLAKRFHPDKFHSMGPEFSRLAERKMKEANMALELLLYRADRNI